LIAATRCTIPAPSLRVPMNGAPRQLSLFCFAKKVTKKGEPAALLFVFRFLLSPLFLLPQLL
jgi:hypothetical protein